MYKENLSGRTAFVSGASAGIGEAVAKMLASNGVNLILSARRIEKLEALKSELEKEYNVKYLVSDFKKKDGYKKSIILSKEYNLYRQDFCGCIYSKRDKIID